MRQSFRIKIYFNEWVNVSKRSRMRHKSPAIATILFLSTSDFPKNRMLYVSYLKYHVLNTSFALIVRNILLHAQESLQEKIQEMVFIHWLNTNARDHRW